MRRQLFILCSLSTLVVVLYWALAEDDPRSVLRSGTQAATDSSLAGRTEDGVVVAESEPRASSEPINLGLKQALLRGPTPIEPPSGLGRLRVQIDESLDPFGAARPGIRLVAVGIVPGRDAVDGMEVRLLDLSKGKERVAVLTDDVGRAVLEVAAGSNMRLFAWEEASGSGRRELLLPAFEADEIRDLHLSWELGEHVRLRGRVRTASATDGAMGGATVSLISGGELLDETVTSPAGDFSVGVERLSHAYVRIQRPGQTPLFFGAEELQADPAAEAEVPVFGMQGIADLEVGVVDSAGDPAPRGVGVRVEVQLESWLGATARRMQQDSEAIVFKALLGPDGRARFSGVPVHAPLRVSLLAPQQGASQSLTLQAGETRALDLTWEPQVPGKLEGVLRDQADQGIADQLIWLVRGRGPDRYFSQAEDVLASARTSKGGKFHFIDVLPGPYWVGPAASDLSADGSPKIIDVAPIGTQVEIEVEQQSELSLRIDRGLFLRGVVKNAAGNRAMGATLTMRSKDWGGTPPLQCSGAKFAIGPLMNTAHAFQATVDDSQLSSGWSESAPDNKQHTLVLGKLDGKLQGVVWDGVAGEPSEATVFLVPRGEAPLENSFYNLDLGVRRRTNSQPGTGFFSFAGLAPGDYSLIAFREGKMVMESVPLILPVEAQNGSVHGIQLTLQPVSSLRFVLRPGSPIPPFASLEIWSEDSLLVRREHYFFGRSEVLFVPPGELPIKVGGSVNGEAQTERTIELQPGEYLELKY